MRRPGRDPVFLQMAALAGAGGIGAIGCAIGLPLYSALRGHPVSPAFALFAAWGFAALAGAYACLRTYAISGDVGPRRPPRGGLRIVASSGTVSARSSVAERNSGRRAA
jgi:hypothetical protein